MVYKTLSTVVDDFFSFVIKVRSTNAEYVPLIASSEGEARKLLESRLHADPFRSSDYVLPFLNIDIDEFTE